jgi:hypothetical protein
MRMAKYKRKDGNHNEIRDGLRADPLITVLDVWDVHGLGCDLICLEISSGSLTFLEIKMPGKFTLTAAEERMRDTFPFHWYVVQSLEEALNAVLGYPNEAEKPRVL